MTEGHKAIYRKYTSVYFCFVIDEGESELAAIDLMQNTVNLLESQFKEVGEYELVFHPDVLPLVIGEVISDGIVQEINLKELQRSVALFN